ncbi:hypothetical protein ANO11243_092160 [Dothideomycetidae sp. 11243]|nr:hypothetical protein ANO11243_092160 [fungal sp. No.11243]
MSSKPQHNVADIVVDSIHAAGVRVVFGVPGAKIDAVFDTLLKHEDIKLIVCRHEQNAAMMAAAHGRITGIPGVCIATSGPGASNLATGLVTATTEGDPVVAIIGSVPRAMNAHRTHQSMKALEVLGPTSKMAVSIDVEDQAAEVMLSAFRVANAPLRGATVVSLPMDVSKNSSQYGAFPSSAFTSPGYGLAAAEQRTKVIELLHGAEMPILFLGVRASTPKVIAAVRKLLQVFPMPVIETFQAAGAVSSELAHLFYGRVGLFRNQTGDKLLAKSDLILMIGYDPVEYDAFSWNADRSRNIIHIDFEPSDYGVFYQPKAELLGSMVENLAFIGETAKKVANGSDSSFCKALKKEHVSWQTSNLAFRLTANEPVHPLTFVSELQRRVSKDTTVSVDVGSVYIYMMRYFFAYEPRRLLCSNGQQTLGVGLPFAISASLTQSPPCSQKVISLSGDGGFMFSSQELVTSVQQKCNITHFIWNDGHYNMVQFQEEMKYGRSSGVKLGGIDFVKFAESFGARGYRVSDGTELTKVMDEALGFEGVSLVDVNIDYSDVSELAGNIINSASD